MGAEECVAVCLGAHPDDVEIGMGATVAKLTGDGGRVVIIDLTNGEPTPYGSVEVRAAESGRAATILGAERRTLHFKNRELFDTVEARTVVATLLRELRPRMLFVPFAHDTHPDHIAASAIGVAARFYGKFVKTEMVHEPHFVPRVFHYMAVHQRMVVEPTFIVDVTDQLSTKLAAVRAYESQFAGNPRNVHVVDMIEGQAHHWGSIGGIGAGEPFFALEPVVLRTPEVIT